MEPIRFADVLFIVLTLLILYAILYAVHKARSKPDSGAKKGTTSVVGTDDEIEDKADVQNNS